MRKYYRVKEKRNILRTTERRLHNWIGYNLRGNRLLKHASEGKIEEIICDGKTRKKT
jgi:hypothetical protein